MYRPDENHLQPEIEDDLHTTQMKQISGQTRAMPTLGLAARITSH